MYEVTTPFAKKNILDSFDGIFRDSIRVVGRVSTKSRPLLSQDWDTDEEEGEEGVSFYWENLPLFSGFQEKPKLGGFQPSPQFFGFSALARLCL